MIEIIGALEIDRFTGKDGRSWVKYSQQAAHHYGAKYPDVFEWPLAFRSSDDDRTGEHVTPYKPGLYELAPGAIRVDPKFGKFTVDTDLPLLPAKQ